MFNFSPNEHFQLCTTIWKDFKNNFFRHANRNTPIRNFSDFEAKIRNVILVSVDKQHILKSFAG